MSAYWTNRQNLMYYIYVRKMVKILGHDCTSMIDVGSHNAGYMEWFSWVSTRHSLDIRQPYSSPAVVGIQQDFHTFAPERRYDFALCLQVLEHVPEPVRFARRLFEIADRVLISVPYIWPAGTHANHVNDPVDEAKLESWTGRRPTYQVRVTEPLRKPASATRLIAYYHPPGEPFSMADAHIRAKALREDEA